VKYLIDSNIFLEILLDQNKAQEAKDALSTVEVNDFFASDFTFHSVGVRLFKEGLFDKFRSLVSEMIDQAGMFILPLHQEDTEQLISVATRFNLDFDDAYQYVAAEKYNLQIVSFDSDFDRTERKRFTQQQVLQTVQ